MKLTYATKLDNGRCVYQTRIYITYNGNSKIVPKKRKRRTQAYIMGGPKPKYKRIMEKAHIYETITKRNQPDSVPQIKLDWSGLFDADRCP